MNDPSAGEGPVLDGTGLAPEAVDLLRRLTELGLRPYAEIGVLGARHAVEASRWMQGDKPEGLTVREVLVAGGDGRLPARVYHPAPGSTLPLTVWFHGGGWVTGSVVWADRPCRAIALASRTVVVSVAYRRAPETPFPGPVDDAEAATRWSLAHAADLGAAPGAAVVAGDSAGGTLAAAVARRIPGQVARQVLVYPALAPPDAVAHPSVARHGEGRMLTRADMDWFWEHYLGGRPVTADAAPLLADDVRGLPPASIAVAGFDPLRDEGVAYAERLRAADVAVELREWPEMIHGFLGMAGELPQTATLIRWMAHELGRDRTWE